MSGNHPEVSVAMIAFRHEKFISRAIESVLSQNAPFAFELVIGEDASDDRTREICEQYADRYPTLIHLLPQELNLGMTRNLYRVFEQFKGEYIAVCEGDDYWSDPFKLQKQFNFLEENAKFSFCYHRVKTLVGGEFTDLIPKGRSGPVGINQLHRRQNNKLVSMMFRRTPGLFDYSRFPLEGFTTPDYRTTMVLSIHGPGYLLNDTMAVYRLHPGGIYSALPEERKLRIGIKNRKAALEYIPMNFKDRMICRMMIFLRAIKLGGIKLKAFFDR
ncbi:MAG: glycosyltransferase [Saprospirales bacterium]|nr:MAG: glycosyltransferase [Saprospirales bacterium]